jgi:hypothetical protein
MAVKKGREDNNVVADKPLSAESAVVGEDRTDPEKAEADIPDTEDIEDLDGAEDMDNEDLDPLEKI